MERDFVRSLSPGLAEWLATGDHFSFRGVKIFYRRSEVSDEVVLCLHGFPTSSYDFRKVWAALSAEYPLFAFDMVGYGFSDKPRNADYTTADQVESLEALLEHLGIKAVHILSHDYGNTITQELLARDGERKTSFAIKTICFLNGALFPETHRPIFAQKMLISPAGALFGRLVPDRFFKHSLASIFGPATKPSAAELSDFAAAFNYNHGKRIAHKLIRYMAERSVFRERWVEALQAMTQPFLFINGSADPVSGKHLIDRFREVVPAQQNIIELPSIGHFPHCEEPATVTAQYIAFRRSATKRTK